VVEPRGIVFLSLYWLGGAVDSSKTQGLCGYVTVLIYGLGEFADVRLKKYKSRFVNRTQNHN
jgi:hypothetical protein